jgi:hypothetical protein
MFLAFLLLAGTADFGDLGTRVSFASLAERGSESLRKRGTFFPFPFTYNRVRGTYQVDSDEL